MSISNNTVEVHPGIAAILEALAALPEDQYLYLEPSDFGYEPRAAESEWVRPVSDFRVGDVESLRADMAAHATHIFGQWYRMDGTIIPKSERPEEWMKQNFGGLSKSAQVTPHAVEVSAGGFLWVSHGVWVPFEETAVNGERAFVFVTVDEYWRRREQVRLDREEAFRQRHADAIAAVRPSWASEVNVHVGGADVDYEVDIAFEHRIGSVGTVLMASLEATEVVLSPEGVGVTVYNADDMTVESALAVAEDLVAMVRRLTGSAAESQEQEQEQEQ